MGEVHSPWVTLFMPALVLIVGLAWPRKRRRDAWSISLGAGFLVLSFVPILVSGYLPTWNIGAWILPLTRCRIMGLLTFSINVTLDGCVDHQEGIADDETHAFFTGLMDESGAMLWGRITYEMMESYWPAVASGEEEATPAMREWAVKLEAKPKYVVSSTRKNFPWTNSHHIAGDLGAGVQRLKDATPAGILLGSGKLATELDRLDLIDEYKFLVHPRVAGHGPTLYQSGLPGARRLELVSAQPLRCGAVAMHYRRARDG